jgi:hypothetical protein
MGACKTAPPTVTYAYQVHAADVAAKTEGPDAPAADTRQMLANARIVAFFPPDPCDAHCGQVVATLERGAEHAGYQVLSWQNLRGAKRPIDFAREANVDVLFQIDRIESGTQMEGAGARTLTFTSGTEPLQVTPSLAQSCQEFAAHADPPHVVAVTATLDAQALSVGDGVTRWRYHRVVAQPVPSTYMPVSFTATGTPSRGGRALVGLGTLALIGGVTMIVFEQTSQKDPLNPSQGEFSTSGLSYAVTAAGLAGIIGGGYLMAQGGTRPSPDDVLCTGTHMVPVSGGPPAPPAAAPSDDLVITPFLDELNHAKGAK